MMLIGLWLACSGRGDPAAEGRAPQWTPEPPGTTTTTSSPRGSRPPPTPPGAAWGDVRLDVARLECDGRDWQLVVETTGEVSRAEVLAVATEPPEAGWVTLEEVPTGSSLWTRMDGRWASGADCDRHGSLFAALAYDADDRLVGCRWFGALVDELVAGELDEVLVEQGEQISTAVARCPLPR